MSSKKKMRVQMKKWARSERRVTEAPAGPSVFWGGGAVE